MCWFHPPGCAGQPACESGKVVGYTRYKAQIGTGSKGVQMRTTCLCIRNPVLDVVLLVRPGARFDAGGGRRERGRGRMIRLY